MRRLRDSQEPITAGDIAELEELNVTTVWIWCRRMERIGLVERTRVAVGQRSRADKWSLIR